jgi:hypothetical protein
MRTVTEIRDRLLDEFRFTVWRPTMRSGINTDASEAMLLHLLDTLCFIDRRDEEWLALKGRYVVGCRWVRGHFEFQHRAFPAYVNEIASVYAEIAFRLGYFSPARLLTEAEMSRLASVVEEPEFVSRDWTEAELHAQFGPPSHEVVGWLTTVACYGCVEPSVKWVFFDLARQLPVARDWLPVPLLRDCRNGYHNQMHLLPLGQRWAGGEGGPAPDFTRKTEPPRSAEGVP